MLRIPDTANPFGQYDVPPPGAAGLNAAILSPSNGSSVTPSSPWWTFGFGDKRFTVVVRVVNNTPFTKVALQPTLMSGAVLISSPPAIMDEIPSGSAKDISFDLAVESNLTGSIPVKLSVATVAGEPESHLLGAVSVATSIDFTLNL